MNPRLSSFNSNDFQILSAILNFEEISDSQSAPLKTLKLFYLHLIKFAKLLKIEEKYRKLTENVMKSAKLFENVAKSEKLHTTRLETRKLFENVAKSTKLNKIGHFRKYQNHPGN